MFYVFFFFLEIQYNKSEIFIISRLIEITNQGFYELCFFFQKIIVQDICYVFLNSIPLELSGISVYEKCKIRNPFNI